MPKDTRPPPYVPSPAPPRPTPDGMFKCQQCGKTLPLAKLFPGEPAEWWRCWKCRVAATHDNPYRNPLGPTAHAGK